MILKVKIFSIEKRTVKINTDSKQEGPPEWLGLSAFTDEGSGSALAGKLQTHKLGCSVAPKIKNKWGKHIVSKGVIFLFFKE